MCASRLSSNDRREPRPPRHASTKGWCSRGTSHYSITSSAVANIVGGSEQNFHHRPSAGSVIGELTSVEGSVMSAKPKTKRPRNRNRVEPHPRWWPPHFGASASEIRLSAPDLQPGAEHPLRLWHGRLVLRAAQGAWPRSRRHRLPFPAGSFIEGFRT